MLPVEPGEPFKLGGHHPVEEELDHHVEKDHARQVQDQVAHRGVAYHGHGAFQGHPHQVQPAQLVQIVPEAPLVAVSFQERPGRIGRVAVAVQAAMSKNHRPRLHEIFPLVERLVPLPALGAGVLLEIAVQLFFQAVQLGVGVSRAQRHPAVEVVPARLLVPVHDPAGYERRTHGLDDEITFGQIVEHFGAERLAHIALHRVHLVEHQVGLAGHLGIHQVPHVQIQAAAQKKAQKEHYGRQAHKEAGLQGAAHFHLHLPSFLCRVRIQVPPISGGSNPNIYSPAKKSQ